MFICQVLKHTASSQLCDPDQLPGAYPDLQEALPAETGRDRHHEEPVRGGSGEAGLRCVPGVRHAAGADRSPAGAHQNLGGDSHSHGKD